MFLARFLAFMAVFLAGWQGFWHIGRFTEPLGKIHTYRKSKKEPLNGSSQDGLNHESQDCLSACLSVRTIVKMIFFLGLPGNM